MIKNKPLGEIDDIFYKLGIAALAAMAVGALLYVCFGINILYDVKVPCAFKKVTGLYCPGCGGTRAVRQLLKGHLWQSFIDYPPVIYGVVVYGEFMVRCFLRKHFDGNFGPNEDGKILPFLYVGIALMLVQWVAKLIAQIGFGYTWVR